MAAAGRADVAAATAGLSAGGRGGDRKRAATGDEGREFTDGWGADGGGAHDTASATRAAARFMADPRRQCALCARGCALRGYRRVRIPDNDNYVEYPLYGL